MQEERTAEGVVTEVGQVSDLNGKHEGEDIYILGTGTSIRVFPLNFLHGKTVIGLNRAWELADVTYCISMVPHLNFPEFTDGEFDKDTIWVTKHDKYKAHASAEQLEYAECNYFFFRTDGKVSITALDEPNEAGRMLSWVREPSENNLYLWTSISQSAVNLAANMGARNIILIGCDNSSLADNHHAHNQHTLWKGVNPDERYMQYYEGLAEMRAVLAHRGVNLVSLSPFLKLDAPEMDFHRLCAEQSKPELIKNEDIYTPSSLLANNRRYLRLTRAVFLQNIKYIKGRFRRRLKIFASRLGLKKVGS